MTIAMLDDGTVFHTPKDSEYMKVNACARTIYVNVASANLGFPNFNIKGTPCIKCDDLMLF